MRPQWRYSEAAERDETWLGRAKERCQRRTWIHHRNQVHMEAKESNIAENTRRSMEDRTEKNEQSKMEMNKESKG